MREFMISEEGFRASVEGRKYEHVETGSWRQVWGLLLCGSSCF